MARFVIFKVDYCGGELGYLDGQGCFAQDTSNPKLFASAAEADEAIRTTGADGKFDLDAFTPGEESETCDSTVYMG